MVIKREVIAQDKTLDVLALRLEKELGCSLRTSMVYYFFEGIPPEEGKKVSSILADAITELYVSSVPFPFSWIVEIGYKEGVTDTVAATTQTVYAHVLQKKITVKTATRYYFLEALPEQRVMSIAASLGNKLIHHITCAQQDGFFYDSSQSSVFPAVVSYADIFSACRERELIFPACDLDAISAYLHDPSEKTRRLSLGLKGITDGEVEMLAQTWSEHCKHRTFNAFIHYSGPDGK